MIELIVLDIDGVLTDGFVIVDSHGNEQKRVNLKDIDAVFELHRRGYKLAAITGEDTEITGYFEKRFPWEYFCRACTSKKDALVQIEKSTGIGRESICYVGDGKYDVEPLHYAGLGLCPANAIDKAKHAAAIILQNDGGKGCLWELVSILERCNNKADPCNCFFQRLIAHEHLFKKMASDQHMMNTVMEIAEEIIGLIQNGGQLFLCGNGGSAADAQHIAAEFVSRFYKERPAMNAEALTVNTSALTAIGNDYGYEQVFARQLEAKARPGDMLIGISTGGRSENVLEALRCAVRRKVKAVMLMGGHDVPEVEKLCDYVVKVPAEDTPRIQEAHIFIGHIMAEYAEDILFKS